MKRVALALCCTLLVPGCASIRKLTPEERVALRDTAIRIAAQVAVAAITAALKAQASQSR